ADYLRRRYEAFKAEPVFEQIQFTEDRAELAEWAPLVMAGRDPQQRVAASRVTGGTDVDFGALSRKLAGYLSGNGAEINYGHRVTDVVRGTDGRWELKITENTTGQKKTVRARFVFVGAGGGGLHLLQRSGIPEAKGFGGFPVSGQFLRCTDESVIAQHAAKVYGQAAVGA
ncbi:malate:quinone oxidoreductase, partial [Arthrobacter deserti]|nr:malate:quinone oxidoreductase [Arthrobacter deserti]